MRGRPSGAVNSRLISSGSPSSQAANVGDASRWLQRIARSRRRGAGRNDSRSNTPTVSNGGFWISRIKAGRSRPRPWVHACSRIFASRIGSGLRSGSASRPSSATNPATVPSIRSANASRSDSSSGGGGANERSSRSGRPAVDPGV